MTGVGAAPTLAVMSTRNHARAGQSRASWVFDALLAAALTAFVLVGTYFASHGQPERQAFDTGAAALILLAGGSLAARRRHPVATLAVVFGSVLVYRAIGYAQGPIWLFLIVAYFSAVLAGKGIVAAGFAVAGFLVFPWIDAVLRDAPMPSVVEIAALAAWLIVLLGIAEAIRIRRERAAEALRMREEETLRRASEERLRIAQELHDALGHHLSLISVQAGVALHVNEELPSQVTGSLTAIREASKEGLTELRSVLEILRRDGDRAPRSPTSTLERLDDLVVQASAAGLDVRTDVRGERRPLPFGVDVAAFRIVQEALTNVTKHARAAVATVTVTYGDEELVVQVDDDGRGASGSADPSSGGRGIVGMRERVTALGGSLEAGPRPEGGFRVRASFPVEGAP
jgi:signal transduction histidine kinase